MSWHGRHKNNKKRTGAKEAGETIPSQQQWQRWREAEGWQRKRGTEGHKGMGRRKRCRRRVIGNEATKDTQTCKDGENNDRAKEEM